VYERHAGTVARCGHGGAHTRKSAADDDKIILQM
jgi:hypothetical protein